MYKSSNLFRIILIWGKKVKKDQSYLRKWDFWIFFYLQILYEEYALPV